MTVAGALALLGGVAALFALPLVSVYVLLRDARRAHTDFTTKTK